MSTELTQEQLDVLKKIVGGDISLLRNVEDLIKLFRKNHVAFGGWVFMTSDVTETTIRIRMVTSPDQLNESLLSISVTYNQVLSETYAQLVFGEIVLPTFEEFINALIGVIHSHLE